MSRAARMSRLVITVVLLVLVWALTLTSFDPADLAVGALVAVALLLAFRSFLFTEEGSAPGPGLARRIVKLPLFVFAVLREITVGTVFVSSIVLGFRRAERPGIVTVSIAERSEVGVAASALAITLSPGELLIDVDSEHDVMLIHVLEARDPDQVRAHHADFYQRYQRGVFP